MFFQNFPKKFASSSFLTFFENFIHLKHSLPQIFVRVYCHSEHKRRICLLLPQPTPLIPRRRQGIAITYAVNYFEMLRQGSALIVVYSVGYGGWSMHLEQSDSSLRSEWQKRQSNSDELNAKCVTTAIPPLRSLHLRSEWQWSHFRNKTATDDYLT